MRLHIGFVFHALSAFSTYTLLQFQHSRIDPLSMLFLLGAGGIFSMAAGYACALGVGGCVSLSVADVLCRLTPSKQVIELVEYDTASSANRLLQRTYLLFSSLIVIVLALPWVGTSTAPMARRHLFFGLSCVFSTHSLSL